MITPNALPMHALLRIAHHALPPGHLPVETMVRLLAVSRRVRTCLMRLLRGLDLSETRFDVLLALYTLGPSPTTLADLAGHADLSRAVLAQTLAQLEAYGWAMRDPDPRDRRTVFVGLTPAGTTIAAEAIRRFLAFAGELGRDLDAADCRALGRACTKLAGRADTLATTDEPVPFNPPSS